MHSQTCIEQSPTENGVGYSVNRIGVLCKIIMPQLTEKKIESRSKIPLTSISGEKHG